VPRVFIAVEIEDVRILNEIIRIRDRVAACSSDIDLKVVEDENLHITLRFIGEISDITVKDVIKVLEGIRGFKKFSIRLRGLGAFPSQSRPRVIWLGISDGSTQLKLIRDHIESGLRKLGISGEREEFVPHITLARIKSFRSNQCIANLFIELGNIEVGTSPVTRVKLKKSTLTPKGPIYTDLFEVQLAD